MSVFDRHKETLHQNGNTRQRRKSAVRTSPPNAPCEESQRCTDSEEKMKHDEQMLTDFGSVAMVIIITVSAIIIFTLWVIS